MAVYTETLRDILDKPFLDGTVNSLLETELAIVPDLFIEEKEVLVEGQVQIQKVYRSFYDIFLRRNWDKEIGVEVISNWCWDVRHIMDDVAAVYLPKLKLQQENFNNLMTRIAEEHDHATNTTYYNPVNKQTTDLKVQNVNERDSVNQSITGRFKSNPEVMEVMTNIRMIYGEILEFCDRLFMGVI